LKLHRRKDFVDANYIREMRFRCLANVGGLEKSEYAIALNEPVIAVALGYAGRGKDANMG
jgi:hypothetical protein